MTNNGVVIDDTFAEAFGMCDPGEGYKVIEVNSIPAWRGLQGVTDGNIAEGLVNDFVSRRLTARLAAVG